MLVRADRCRYHCVNSVEERLLGEKTNLEEWLRR